MHNQIPLSFDWLPIGIYITLVRSVAYGHEKTVKQAAKLLGIKGKRKKAQSKAINDGLNGHDLLVIAPTSFGKSAVFQILALLKGGLSIVVVPTLSLLHDQAEQLQQLGIQAEILASDCDSLCEEDICEIIRQYGHLILYTTPESLRKLELLHTPVSLLIVDECHCVVSWGYWIPQRLSENWHLS